MKFFCRQKLHFSRVVDSLSAVCLWPISGVARIFEGVGGSNLKKSPKTLAKLIIFSQAGGFVPNPPLPPDYAPGDDISLNMWKFCLWIFVMEVVNFHLCILFYIEAIVLVLILFLFNLLVNKFLSQNKARSSKANFTKTSPKLLVLQSFTSTSREPRRAKFLCKWKNVTRKCL